MLDLTKIKELEAKATKGPWKATMHGPGEASIHSGSGVLVLPFFPPCKGADIDFILQARTDLLRGAEARTLLWTDGLQYAVRRHVSIM